MLILKVFFKNLAYILEPENISGFRVLNAGFRVGFGYQPLGFGSGSGGLKCRVYPPGFGFSGTRDHHYISVAVIVVFFFRCYEALQNLREVVYVRKVRAYFIR